MKDSHSPIGKRARRRQELIDAIVDTAAPLFARKGYGHTGVAELCEELGMARGHLYHLIGSKENLLHLTYERFIDLLFTAAIPIRDSDASPEARLRLLVRHLMRTIADHQDYVWVFFTEWRSLSPERHAEYQRRRREFHDLVEGVLLEGVDDGSLVAPRPTLLVRGLLGMANDSYQWIDPAGELAPEAIADIFTNAFLDGVRHRTR